MASTSASQAGLTSSIQYRFRAVLFLVVLALDVLFMPRTVFQGDPAAWRQEANSLLQHGRLWIDPKVILDSGGEPGQYFDWNDSDHHWYSKYGVVNAIMAIPPMLVVNPYAAPQTPQLSWVIAINSWNIVLCLLVAQVLYTITGRYCDDPWRRLGYVLACLFGTYLWYYQRAQNSEIYQVLFFCLFYECLLRSVKRTGPPSAGWLGMAWLFVGLLVLTRLFFGFLIPLMLGVCFLVMLVQRQSWRRCLPVLAGAPLLILGILGWINDVKFGSPYLSGYHQWRPDEHLMTGSWLDGVWGLLVSCHWSIFLYFPLLFAAIGGARRFAREHWIDATLILGVFITTLLLLGKIPSWRGEWTYGPRYMLFVLPILALPALYFADGWDWRRMSIALGILGFSVWMQVEVNRADFWLFYRLEMPLDGQMDKETAQYFFDHPEGIIYYDLASHRQNLDQTLLFRHLRTRMGAGDLSRYREEVEQALEETNLFWWPPRRLDDDGGR